MNRAQQIYHFRKTTVLSVCVFALCWLIPIVSQAQNGFRDSTATFADTSRIVIAPPNTDIEQRIIFQMLLLYGADFFNHDPFLPKGATYGMLNDRQIPNRNNIDELTKSVDYNLRQQNKQSKRDNTRGKIAGYLSLLLLFY